MNIKDIEQMNIKPHQKIKLIFKNNYQPIVKTGYFVKNTEKNIELLADGNLRLCSRIDIIKNIELV